MSSQNHRSPFSGKFLSRKTRERRRWRRTKIESLEDRRVLDSSGLIGYWQFDDANMLGQDSTDNENHLTVFFGGSADPDGIRGTGIRLDGIDDVLALDADGQPATVDVPTDLPVGDEPYSISAWVKTSSDQAQTVLGWGNEQTRQANLLNLAGGAVQNSWSTQPVDTLEAPVARLQDMAVEIVDEDWHHLVAVFDGMTRSIWVDGSLAISDAPPPTTGLASHFRIGAGPTGQHFNGSLDEVAIFTTVLNGAEIAALAGGDPANAIQVAGGVLPAPVAHWSFDDPTQLGKDLSNQGNDLQPFGDVVEYDANGQYGGALRLGGNNDFLALADLGGNEDRSNVPTGFPIGNEPYTVSTWIRPEVTGHRGMIGWGRYGFGRQVNAFRLMNDNGFRHYWWGRDLDAPNVANEGFDLDDGDWHHALVTYDGTTRQLWLDGIVLNQDIPGANNAQPMQFRLGNTNNGENFFGSLDDVAVWNQSLTSDQILALAAGTAQPTSPNNPPQANDISYNTDEDIDFVTPPGQGVLSNDTDPDGDPLVALATSSPFNGHAVVWGDGQVFYTPLENFNGQDSFTYVAYDGTQQSSATVGLSIAGTYDPAIATADTFVADTDGTLVVDADLGLLANDLNPDQVVLTAVLDQDVTQGELTLNPDGSFTYTPTAGFSGTDSFTYSLNDGIDLSNVVTVQLIVDQRPVAVADEFTIPEDQTLTPISGVLENDVDSPDANLEAMLQTEPASGSITLDPDGSFEYIPAPNFFGTDTFTYIVSDGDQNSAPAIVTIVVTAIDDPPVTGQDEYTVIEGLERVINTAQGVLQNDFDVEGAQLTATVSQPPANGTLQFADDGSFSYQPNAGFVGTDIFLYIAHDGQLDSEPTPVHLTVELADAQIVINEIHYDPLDNSQPAEFIELFHRGVTTVDLSGWQFSAGVAFTIEDGTTLEPGEFLVVAQAPDFMLNQFGVAAQGPWVGRLSNSGEEVVLRNANGQRVDRVDYNVGFPWPLNAEGEGPSIELIHPDLDNDLAGSWRSGQRLSEPTPGSENSNFSANAPPQIRQVDHEPNQPQASEATTITAKVTDPDGVASVELVYQVVLPGSYLPGYLPVPLNDLLNNPAAEPQLNPEYLDPTNWTTVAMSDDGLGPDEVASDGVYSVELPPQIHRSLLRYRIRVADTAGADLIVPYADDPSLNFAYYSYDGVPDYDASVSVTGSPQTYASSDLESVPVYQLLVRNEDIVEARADNGVTQIPQGSDARFAFNWGGTWVYDGEVYDHIKFRLRGANGRYQVPPSNPSDIPGKRNWRIRFNKGHYLQTHDRWGDEFPTEWRTLNVGRMFGNRIDGSWGLAEQVNFDIWNQIGVPAPYSHTFHWRIVDGVEEAPSGDGGQYAGDFWGIARGFEDYDARFLDAHDLPQGNLYKLVNQTRVGADQQRYQAPGAVRDASDHDNIEGTLDSNQSADWINAHVDYEKWYLYHAWAQAIKHYDYWPSANKNAAWYFYPNYTAENNFLGEMWTLPFDSDASWGPSWNQGIDRPYEAIFATGGGTPKPEMQIAYRNTIREIRDLIWQPDQLEPLIRQYASFIAPLENADRDRWSGAPASEGRQDFPGQQGQTLVGKIEDMLAFAFQGGNWPGGSVGAGGRAAELDFIADGAENGLLPVTPTISYIGTDQYPLDGLSLETTAFSDPQGTNTFAALEWRVAEVSTIENPGQIPLNDPIWQQEPIRLEWSASWESGVLTDHIQQLELPATAVDVGKTYRARVRMQDDSGRWSHWSAPHEFTASAPTQSDLVVDSVRISEIMYNPAATRPGEIGTDADQYEFVELVNRGEVTVSLENVQFNNGIDFVFPAGPTSLLQPDERLVVVRNEPEFRSRYGEEVRVAGVYDGSLRNSGERLTLSFGGNIVIDTVNFGDGADWPALADGKGASLQRMDLAALADTPENWTHSLAYLGTPSAAPTTLRDIVINEVLTNTDPPVVDAIELYNSSATDVDISGWWLSDNCDDFHLFQIPANTMLAAGDFIVFDEQHFNPTQGNSPTDFALNGDAGDELLLLATNAAGEITRFADYVTFGAAATGVSLGLYPDGQGILWPSSAVTLDGMNAPPQIGPVLISEVNYNPGDLPADDEARLEYIELHNVTDAPVDLLDWQLSGGIEYSFSLTSILEPEDVIIVTAFDPGNAEDLANFTTTYEVPAQALIVGPFSGRLGNGADRIDLTRPGMPPLDDPTFTPRLLVDSVAYEDTNPWHPGADGGGFSLTRILPATLGTQANSWGPDFHTPGEIINTLGVLTATLNGDRVDPPNLPTAEQPTQWSIQRSLLETIVIEFNHHVDILPQDIRLINLGLDAPNQDDVLVNLSPNQLRIGNTSVTLDFTGSPLSDGVYELVLENSVHDIAGRQIDGDRDGTAGDAWSMRGSEENRFHQYTADLNGDSGITIFDFPTFSYWFGINVPAAPVYVDLNRDGGVSIFDFAIFAENFGGTVVYPAAKREFPGTEIQSQEDLPIEEQAAVNDTPERAFVGPQRNNSVVAPHSRTPATGKRPLDELLAAEVDVKELLEDLLWPV